ncbi:FecR family protein [Dyella silvae]|uniref:FecR family protein n=1 Tax=Dyella silvae TaxID=2994424 RepID=UPI0022646074|nr:FecR domain-containing protein [Dyella silvae]
MNDRGNFDAARRARRITEQAAAWYIEQHDEPDTRSRAAFLAWLRQSPEHVAEYMAIAQMHGDLKSAASLEKLTSDELAEWAGRSNPVVLFPQHNIRHVDQRVGASSGKWRAVAGAAVAAAVAALALLGGMHWRTSNLETHQQVVAEAHAVRSVTLPDGTLVQLDKGSVIDVSFDAHYRRIDVVSGNALFDVGKDPARPMLVNVGGHVLQDIGTVFDVMRGTGGDTLTVISGHVRVWNAPPAWPNETKTFMDTLRDDSEAVADLIAGQQVTMHSNHVSTVRAAPLNEVTAWLPTDIHFQRETVGEVARRFNAYTTTPLIIEDPRIADMRISGVFHANNPQAFVTYLASLPGVYVVQGGDRVRIVASSSHGNDHAGKL